jgi:hypothetical protein
MDEYRNHCPYCYGGFEIKYFGGLNENRWMDNIYVYAFAYMYIYICMYLFVYIYTYLFIYFILFYFLLDFIIIQIINFFLFFFYFYFYFFYLFDFIIVQVGHCNFSLTPLGGIIVEGGTLT